MNRIKHKITVVLALFGVVFIAPVALAQITANDNANIEIIDRPPELTVVRDLQFGQVHLPASGTSNFGLTCGSDGTATVVDADTIGAAPSSPDRECGQINLTAGDGTITGYTLRFEGANTADLTGGSGLVLQTSYALYSGGISIINVEADGSTDSGESTAATATAGSTAEFYIGGTVAVPTSATAQTYEGTYEVLLTLP